MDQDGYLSKKLYEITLSKEFNDLYNEGVKQSKSLSWIHVAEKHCNDREFNFPSTVVLVGSISLEEATGADVGTLIKYFAYRNKTLEEISKNMKYKAK